MEEENKEKKVSEISIQIDRELPDKYVVSIDNKFFIDVTVSESDSEDKLREEKLREWIRGIQAIYGKRNRRNLVVGLSALCSQNYANGVRHFRTKDNRGEKRPPPYDLLQLCVGSHCLLMEVCHFRSMPRVVRDFLYDNRTVVVGVGIEQIAKKLEKEREEDGLMIRKRVELRKEADKFFPGNNFERCSLEELAEVVLGGEVVLVKPKKMKWWDDQRTEFAFGYGHHKHSKEMIKYASAEAFLACKIGSNLLKDSY